MRHIFYVLMVLAFSAVGLNAQTSLGAGDLAIVGFASDNPDAFAFVTLVDLESGTEIKYTDNGWKADNTFRANEGTKTLTLTTNVDCGTVFYSSFSTSTFNTAQGSPIASIGASGSQINLSASGDQILMYQGDDASPTFITAVNFNGPGTWAADATSSNTSALPAGLTDGTTAVGLGETDNGNYGCGTNSETAAALATAINSSGNWNTSNSPMPPSICLFTVTDCTGGGGGDEGCGTPFFSEYIEGSSFNKCIEIYNPTGSDIDLSAEGYQLRVYFNGNTTFTSISLTGTLLADDVYVVCHSSASSSFDIHEDQSSGSLGFNGNDAIELVNNSGTVDIFGSIGQNPGSRWQSANGNDTENQTLVRNPNVYQGVTANSVDFPTLQTEWTEHASNTSSFLGAHTFDGCPEPIACVIEHVSMEVSSGCNDNGTININDDYAVGKVVVKFMGAPATGDLVLTGDVSASVPVASLSGNMVMIPVQFTADGGPVSISAYFSEEPGCALLNANAATAPEPCSTVPDCSYPFFSEYIEGSGNNKCLEIYNPTGADINLDDYRVEIYFNGSTSAGNTINFAPGAVIASGDSYVICSIAADDEFLDLADEATGGTSWFNGDDAVALIAIALEAGEDVAVDVIGQIGFDPGSEWNAGGADTQNSTIRRMPWVQAGDNVGINAFNPGAEWEAFDINTEYGLGYHGSLCVDPDVPFGWNPFTIGCQDGSFEYDDVADEWTLTSNCFNPATGQDDLTFAFQEQCGDIELSAKVESITGLGKAGLMLRESTAPGSKYIWIYKTAGNNVFWSVRKTTNGLPQKTSRFAFGKKWLRITRQGNLFRGWVSFNGIVWKKEFQSILYMDDCMFAGPVVESNVDGATTTAVFSNVAFGGNNGYAVLDNGDVDEFVETGEGRNGSTSVAAPELDQEIRVTEVTLTPNPATSWLEIALPKGFESDFNVTVMDLSGKVLFTQQFGNQETLIALDLTSMNLSEGTYLLNLKSKDQNVTKRFVKVQ